MPWSYLHCCQINEKCFHKNNNHKEIEILCCESFSKLQGFHDLCTHLWFVLWLLWTGFDTRTLISLPRFISYLLTCVHNRNRFPSISSSVQKWKKTKFYKSGYRAGNIMQWLCRAIKLFIISVKIYAAITIKYIK